MSCFRSLACVRLVVAGCAALGLLSTHERVAAQTVVPGTGHVVNNVGDDFEDPEWKYIFNGPKSSGEQDGRRRTPFGHSVNGRWVEGDGRGHPDVIQRVPTPEGGLPDSAGSLLLQTRDSGIPGVHSIEPMQDDLFMIVAARVGGYISVAQTPSAVVRVFLPPFEEWEARNGSSFAFRATVRGIRPGHSETEPYWPGLFFNFYSGKYRRDHADRAFLVVRAGPRGQDYQVLEVKQTGWWTLGMSFTPDGRIHYYAHPGIDDLTSADHVASQFPYGFQALQFKQVFFDVWNQVDGHNWSTKWIIDDPTVYTLSPLPQLTKRPPTKRSAAR